MRAIVVLLLITISAASAQLYIHNLNGNYTMPRAPTNPELGVSYPCVFEDMSVFARDDEDTYMVSVETKNGPNVHHSVFYPVPADSALFDEGGVLHGRQSGDLILDCFEVTDGVHRTNIIHADQVPSTKRDYRELFDKDNGIGNGFTYGVPFGRQNGYGGLLVQHHVDDGMGHNMHRSMEDGGMDDTFEISLSTKIITTSVRPEFLLGYMMVGVPPKSPGDPFSFMDIPYSSEIDGHSITATILPNAMTCDIPGAVPCDTCCPTPGVPVDIVDPFAASRLFPQGLTQVKIVSSFLHAHGQQRSLTLKKIAMDGTRSLIDECIGCGHGTADPGAFHVLDTPVDFIAGEGFELEAVYNPHPDKRNIVNGAQSGEEMAIAFLQYAYPSTLDIPNPGHLALYGSICDGVNNAGTSIATPQIPLLHAVFPGYTGPCNYPSCAFDPQCVVSA